MSIYQTWKLFFLFSISTFFCSRRKLLQTKKKNWIRGWQKGIEIVETFCNKVSKISCKFSLFRNFKSFESILIIRKTMFLSFSKYEFKGKKMKLNRLYSFQNATQYLKSFAIKINAAIVDKRVKKSNPTVIELFFAWTKNRFLGLWIRV